MNAERSSWSAMVREIGEAFLALLRAELEAVARDLGASGRALLRALVVAAIAGTVAFWAFGLIIYLAVELLALVLPRWGAAAIVLGVFLVATLVLARVAAARLRALETPAATVRRRVEDGRRWWQERIATTPPEPALPARDEPDRIEEELP